MKIYFTPLIFTKDFNKANGKLHEMVFQRSKLTPLQKIGGADYEDSEDEESDVVVGGYGSDTDGGRGDVTSRRRRKPLTYAEFLKSVHLLFFNLFRSKSFWKL